MKKYFLTLFVFISSAGYVFAHYMGTSASNSPVSSPATETSGSITQTTSGTPAVVVTQPTPTQTQTPTPTPTPAPKQTGQYVDGSYTGASADAYYGFVQVRATIAGGKLTAVDFLQYPNDRRTSQQINSQAMPLLTQEAIKAQSANVSGVSGASDTSAAFVQSLGDALSQAKNS